MQKWNVCALVGERWGAAMSYVCGLYVGMMLSPLPASRRSDLLNEESADNEHSVMRYERKCRGLGCLHFIISFMDSRNVNNHSTWVFVAI